MINIKNKTYKLALDLQEMNRHAADIESHSYKIKRLINRTIAQEAEDRLAIFLYETLEDKDVSIYINGKLGEICPDIIIMKNNVVIGIVELKINFGWCRNIFDPVDEKGKLVYKGEDSYLHKRIGEFKKLKEKSEISFNTMRTKEKKEEKEKNQNGVKLKDIGKIYVTVDKNCKMSIVSSSCENYRGINNNMIDDFEDFIKRYPNYKDSIDFYVITERFHKNETRKDIDKSIDRLFKNKYGMNKLVKNLKKLL